MRFRQRAMQLRRGRWSFVVATLLTLLPQFAQAQSFVWQRQFGTTRDDQGNAVAASVSGVYVGGKTNGVFPGQSSAGAGDVDAFVARYDVAGNQIWVRQFGSTTVAQDFVQGVAADSTGVYVVGVTSGALSEQSNAGSSDAFVRKYDLNGTEQWTRQFGTSAQDEALAVAVDATGVYVAGRTQGALPGQTSGALNGDDAYVRKYDTGGNEQWTRQFGTSDGDEAYGIATNSGSIYVVGSTIGTLGGVGSSPGGKDGFLRKYDGNGTVVWTQQFSSAGSNADEGFAVSADASGIYVAGDTTGTFAGQTRLGGIWDVYSKKFNSDGVEQWTRQFGTATEDHASGVAVSSAGVHVVGSTNGALPGQTKIGLTDSYVRRYDVNGTETGTLQFGNNANDEAFGAAADSTGVYVCGYLNANPFNDAYVSRIPPPPDVSVGGVVNNASFAASPVPVAPGSIAAVFGANLNDGSLVQFSSYGPDGKLVTSLGGASATINNIPTPMFYSFPGQLGVQVPFELAGQTTGTIVVTVGGQSSIPRTINLDAFAPGIFTVNQQGSGIAAVLHQDGITPVTVQNPARPNEVVVFFVTGLGAVTPALATGAKSIGNRTVTNPVVTIDSVQAGIDFSGAAPDFVGLNQINLHIPAGTRTASNIPVLVTIGGKQSNSATIPVGP